MHPWTAWTHEPSMDSAAIKPTPSPWASTSAASRPSGRFPELAFLEQWLRRGYAGSMTWLARSAKKRRHVRAAEPTAESVIVTATVYNTDRAHTFDRTGPRDAVVSRYAWGDDYHVIVRQRARRARRVDAGGASRAVRHADLRRYRPGPGARVRAVRGPRLDRQEHLPHQSRARLVALPRLPDLQPAARARRARARSVRHLHRLPRRRVRPARSSRPASSTPRKCLSYLTIEQKSAIPEALRRVARPARLRLRHLPGRLSLESSCRGVRSAASGSRGARSIVQTRCRSGG